MSNFAADPRRMRDSAAERLLVRRVAGTAAGLVAAGVLLLAGTPPAIALGDVDHFKSINDRVGHTAGDRALQDVAAALRGSDLCFRWAGDEFALLLPGASLPEAWAAADRVSASLDVGISFGCAELAPGIGAIELLEAADRALRARKPAR